MGARSGFGLAVWITAVAGRVGAQEPELLFPRLPELQALTTSVEGVWLAGPPIVYYRGALASPDGARVLPQDEMLVLSRERSRVLLAGREGADRTWFERPPGPRVTLDGDLRFAIDAAGQTTIAFAEEADESGQRAVLSLGRDGELLAGIFVRGLRWISVSDDGGSFAVASDSVVRVLERSGSPLLPDLKETSLSGAIATDGAWLALALAGPGRLKWVSLSDPAATPIAFDVAAPGQVILDSSGDFVAHVASREVAIFDLRDGTPRLLQRRPAPATYGWRSAAWDAQGRLALGRIRVERRARRDPSDPADPFRPGAARLAVDFLAAAAGDAVASSEWEVPFWNYAAPALSFGPDGRCIVDTGHACFVLEPPW